MKTNIKIVIALLVPLLLINYPVAAKKVNADETEQVEPMEKEEDGRAPIGCYDSGYHFDLATLHLKPGENGENQSMYFLFNTLGQSVNLFQMRNEESSRSTYLNHTIGGREWGVLSTSEKNVKFICTVPSKKSQYGEVVDCAKSLKICEYTNVRYGLNNRGNYWLINSSTKNGAVNAVVHYGIIPGR